MPGFLIASLVAVATLLGLVLVAGRLRRRRLVALASREGVERVALGVSCTLLVHGTRRLLGFEPDTAVFVSVDLVHGRRRFAVVCDRGLLVDVEPGGPGLRSARCTGPGRLVLEGELPAAHGRPPVWRLELTVPDAEAWASGLSSFARAGDVPFASFGGGGAQAP